jgi:bifunctional oxygenase/reductase
MDVTVPGPYAGLWKVPQTTTEQLLRNWARELGADLRAGHEVRGVDDGGDAVTVTADGPDGLVTWSASWLVACDGEDSTVRRLLGADFPGQDAERELIRADVADLQIPDRRFQRLERGLAIAARRPDGITRVMVGEYDAPPRRRAAPPDFAELVATWRRVTGEDIAHGTAIWLNAFGDAARQLRSYRHGRVLFAGDAAHRQMPIGGQALNLGLQDAVNLGWKLAAVVARGADEQLIDSYHAERHPVGARTLGNIRAQALIQLGGPEVEPVRRVLGELIAHGPARAHLAAMITGADVTYPAGAAGHPLAGKRFPLVPMDIAAAPGSTVAQLLRSGRGVLLHRPRAAGATTGPDDAYGAVVDAVTVLAAPEDVLPAATAALIRPDGHVAWAGDPNEPGLAAALRRWFGATIPAAPVPAPTTSIRKWGNTMRLQGRTALVTGASRGMGGAIARRLAADGALVAVHYGSRKDAADAVVEAIEKDGGSAFTLRADLAEPGAVHDIFLGLEQNLKERTGSSDLHVLVNNAGIMSGGEPPEETTAERIDEIFAVNARAPFLLIRRALETMPDGGRIINISSGLTRVANPQEIAYAMSKGAVEQLARHFAKHLGPRGITVNSVAPGITRNENPVFGIPEAVEQMSALSAFGRVGEPEDIADVVAFLASDDGRWVTGAFIDATGGTLLG